STAMELLTNPNNLKMLSVATIWEMQIKSSLGKLNLELSLDEIVKSQVRENNFQLLSTLANYIQGLGGNLKLVAEFPENKTIVIKGFADLSQNS
ncbi:hypothetical protein ACN4EE_22120, partial [Geminocystis sp. CENA526]